MNLKVVVFRERLIFKFKYISQLIAFIVIFLHIIIICILIFPAGKFVSHTKYQLTLK